MRVGRNPLHTGKSLEGPSVRQQHNNHNKIINYVKYFPQGSAKSKIGPVRTTNSVGRSKTK